MYEYTQHTTNLYVVYLKLEKIKLISGNLNV